jgi:hypothetical protein
MAVLRGRPSHLSFRVKHRVPRVLALLNGRDSPNALIHQIAEAARTSLIIRPSNLDDRIVFYLVLI